MFKVFRMSTHLTLGFTKVFLGDPLAEEKQEAVSLIEVIMDLVIRQWGLLARRRLALLSLNAWVLLG